MIRWKDAAGCLPAVKRYNPGLHHGVNYPLPRRSSRTWGMRKQVASAGGDSGQTMISFHRMNFVTDTSTPRRRLQPSCWSSPTGCFSGICFSVIPGFLNAAVECFGSQFGLTETQKCVLINEKRAKTSVVVAEFLPHEASESLHITTNNLNFMDVNLQK